MVSQLSPKQLAGVRFPHRPHMESPGNQKSSKESTGNIAMLVEDVVARQAKNSVRYGFIIDIDDLEKEKVVLLGVINEMGGLDAIRERDTDNYAH